MKISIFLKVIPLRLPEINSKRSAKKKLISGEIKMFMKTGFLYKKVEYVNVYISCVLVSFVKH